MAKEIYYTINDLRHTASKLDGSHQRAMRNEFKCKPENANFMQLMGYFQDHQIKIRRAPKVLQDSR